MLKPGYARRAGAGRQRADGTITLIKGPQNVLVDTGGPQDKEAVVEGLIREGLSPADVGWVVCSHGHSDHVGNLNLFPGATLIVSHDVSKDDLYVDHPFAAGTPFVIDDEVEVIATPGHTEQDVSVVVRTARGIYVVAGDLFESGEDRENEELWRCGSQDPEAQERSRRTVLELADYVVPGHGDLFEV